MLKKLLENTPAPRSDSWSDISEAMDDTAKIRDLGLNMVLNLNRDLIVHLATKGTVCRYTQGEVIFRQGDVGDAFYLVKTGTVSATVKHQSGQHDVTVRSISEGHYFGEFALLNDAHSRRTATITATTDTEVIRMSKDDFVTVVKQNQQLHQQLWHAMRDTLKAEEMLFGSHHPDALPPATHAILQAFGLEVYKKVSNNELEIDDAQKLFTAFEQALRDPMYNAPNESPENHLPKE